MTNVSLKIATRECVPDNQFLGYEGENEVNKLIFKFEDGFFDGSGLLNVHRGEQKGYVTVNKVGETYELSVENSLLAQKGDVRFQLSITSTEGKVIKFDPFVMVVKDSIDTDAELPEEYPSWIDEANAKLAEMDKAIEDAEKLDAKVEPTQNGALITITGRDGITTTEVLHGTGGGGGGGIAVETDPVYMKDKPYLALKSEIPINLSQLENDAGYITEEDIPEPPKVPTKTSELENDSNFATESYVKNEIANAQLGGDGGDIDLSGYATKDDLNNKVDKVAGKSLIADTEIMRLASVKNYDDSEIKQQLNNKADSDDIPTKTSQLANDSNFATKEELSEKQDKLGYSIVTLSQVEYDALVSAGTVDDNTYYFIKEE